MKKFDLFSVKCKMCDWQTEIAPGELDENFFCEKCGSGNLKITKKTLHMLKKGGKFVTDIGFSAKDNIFDVEPVKEVLDQNKEPLLIVKENGVRISEDMTNEELKDLLSKMNNVRNKILDRIEVNREELIERLL